MKKRTEKIENTEYPLASSQEIEKLWVKIRGGNVIAKQKMIEKMKGHIYTWIQQVRVPFHEGVMREIAQGALQQAMSSFSGGTALSWLSYCEKTVMSALLLYVTGIQYTEEFVCEHCGFVMQFQR